MFSTAALAADSVAPSGTTLVPHDPGGFRSDPTYPSNAYDAEGQLKIYGDKRAVPTARPLLELGREMYREGPFQPGVDVLGKKNLVFANLLVSGDWRSAAARLRIGRARHEWWLKSHGLIHAIGLERGVIEERFVGLRILT